MLKTSNIGISLSKPAELLTALTAICKVSSLIAPSNSFWQFFFLYLWRCKKAAKWQSIGLAAGKAVKVED